MTFHFVFYSQHLTFGCFLSCMTDGRTGNDFAGLLWTMMIANSLKIAYKEYVISDLDTGHVWVEDKRQLW